MATNYYLLPFKYIYIPSLTQSAEQNS